MPTSSRLTIPRSPCSESTGCRNIAGVPVDVNVAAIFRAIRPDLPTPDTITRPFAAARISIARANAGPSVSARRWTAAASSASTRLPRSTSCFAPVCGLAARAGLCTDGLPDAMPDVHGEPHDPGELVERHHVRSVGRRAGRIGMGLEEEAVGARGGGGVQQGRNEAAVASARAVPALARLLDRVRGVEDDGRVTRGAEPWKAAHVDDEVAVAEECAALGDGDFRRAAGTHFLDGAAHLLRRHPLAFLDVHRPARLARGDQQIRLATEERGDLENVGHACGQGDMGGFVDVGEDRKTGGVADLLQRAEPGLETGPARGVQT